MSRLQAADLPSIVAYHKKKVIEIQVEELRGALSEAVTSDPPAAVEEIQDMIEQKKKAHDLPQEEIIQVIPSSSSCSMHAIDPMLITNSNQQDRLNC